METPVILFEEIQRSQRLRNKWFYGAAAVLFGLVLVWNYFSHKETPVFTRLLWSGFIIFILLQLFVSTSFQLVTQIREDGIYVRFPPYQSSFSKYSWDSIKEIYIRQFDPLKEYGYGIRTGPNGKGYTLPGNTGIQIIFNDNTTLIISTKQPEEVMEILRKTGRVK
jgi:hypothetical protein